MVLGAFILPPYLGAIGWILLAGPNSGFINQAWRWRSPAARHGLVQRLYLLRPRPRHGAASFPLIFIFVKSALDLVSSEMEDAANILGAGTCAPRSSHAAAGLPSILGGVILVFLEAVALFGTPASSASRPASTS